MIKEDRNAKKKNVLDKLSFSSKCTRMLFANRQHFYSTTLIFVSQCFTLRPESLDQVTGHFRIALPRMVVLAGAQCV